MKSVPPRGSGWVVAFSIAKCQLAHWVKANRQSEIDNWQCRRPTRYRKVVLTSWDRG
jgi:hypothetical protein